MVGPPRGPYAQYRAQPRRGTVPLLLALPSLFRHMGLDT